MATPFDPRPAPLRQPDEVEIRVVDNTRIDDFASALRSSVARAIDTETVYVRGLNNTSTEVGQLRVVSAATRGLDGLDTAWVVDVNNIDRADLAAALSDVVADAWNADFDARVIERDLIEPALATGRKVTPPSWWDAQLADALIHQGLSGFGFYHGLAWAAECYLGIRAEGKGTTQLSYTATDDLSGEQIRYAAADAVETLWVGQAIRDQIAEAGLTTVCDLEQGARPFLDHMERNGLPFNWDGWSLELEKMVHQKGVTLGRLAELTGGGQGSLFSEHLEPAWNPGSERQTKEILNHHSPDLVHAWSRAEFSESRLLLPTDSLNATVLSEIGGAIAEEVLEYRDLTKTLSTYGESIKEHLHSDGRLHPEYLQVVGTNTGRLASRNPNAQNLTPRMKPHISPSDPNRVFVYSDLSQAELRFVAQVSHDENLRQAFVDGIDVHVATADRMFGVDMQALKINDRDRYDELRAKAKRINFGIVYGQRGAGLARTLSLSGVQTSASEGGDLLDAYLGAYPGVGQWVRERDKFIEELSESPGEMDWPLTLQLHSMWASVRSGRRTFRNTNRRWPSAEELQELLSTPATAPIHDQVGPELVEVAWALSFNAPVALSSDGTPFGFASFTPAGRRQQFTMHTEGVLATAAATVVQSAKPGPVEIRQQLSERLDVRFAHDDGTELSNAEVTKLLEDRSLRRAVVDEVSDHMGAEALRTLLDRALRSRIRRMANAYRNAPIQGGVADVMLDAYGDLCVRLAQHQQAIGVQTVHDSVVVECNLADAKDVAITVKETLEAAMARWCPDVPAVADTDVRSSLADSDVLYELR